MRIITDTGDGTGGSGGSGGGTGAVTKYLDLRWAYTDTVPRSLLAGFEVIVCKPGTPDDSNTWLLDKIRPLPADRRAVAALALSKTFAVAAYVRPVFSTGDLGTWALIGQGTFSVP